MVLKKDFFIVLFMLVNSKKYLTLAHNSLQTTSQVEKHVFKNWELVDKFL
jgi:hypothetical protein